MSQRKCLRSADTGNLSIKQFFTSKQRTAITVEPPNQESASSSNTVSLQNDCTAENYEEEQDQEHAVTSLPTVSTKRQSVPSNKTFQSWIKLKGFDESLGMNVFILHADGGVVCLLCSKHPIAAATS